MTVLCDIGTVRLYCKWYFSIADGGQQEFKDVIQMKVDWNVKWLGSKQDWEYVIMLYACYN